MPDIPERILDFLSFFPTILLFVYVSCFMTFQETSSTLSTKPSIVFLNTTITFIIFQEFFHIFLIILSNSLLFIFSDYSIFSYFMVGITYGFQMFSVFFPIFSISSKFSSLLFLSLTSTVKTSFKCLTCSPVLSYLGVRH